MRRLILLVLLFLAVLSPARAQPFADLGHALSAAGYKSTVWVNSFDRRLAYLAHGVFYPDTPIGRAGSNARYGMALRGSGTVSVDKDGYLMATGTATNPNAAAAEGDVSINLLKSGSLAGTAEVPFTCGPLATCPWEAHFLARPSDYPHTSARAFTVAVYRHVEGSTCGGELTPDLNLEPCRTAVITKFRLPLAYHFTTTDFSDTNYLSTPGATTTALCAAILPLCGGPPPPPADPCAAWLATSQQWLLSMPPPAVNGSCADLTAALATWAAAAPQPPDACLNQSLP
ncbi:MAG TPA: hypothetical protein VIA62_27595 [Thermoanaerobaculia bacterium]|jgi:hypothetical protein|nr:hypothetical protein [Thermoanaerobaculia bacterium]